MAKAYLVAILCAVLSGVSGAMAQGEYTGYGQSGVGFGVAREVGQGAGVTAFSFGICGNGKSDIAFSMATDSRSSGDDKVWGVAVRSFFKKKAERQTTFASVDLTLTAGDAAIFTVGGTGYGNLGSGEAGYAQLSFGGHLVFNPQGVGKGSVFHFLMAMGASYVLPLSLHTALAFETGLSVLSGVESRGGKSTSGAVGVTLIIPWSRSTSAGKNW